MVAAAGGTAAAAAVAAALRARHLTYVESLLYELNDIL